MNIQKLSSTTAILGLLLSASALCMMAADPQGLLKPAAVKALVINAKTPADHMKLARHYTAMAEKHEAEAKEHEALALQYTNHPTAHETKHPMSAETAGHCKLYAEHCRKAAAEMRAMAAAHTEMAKSAK